MLHTLQIPRWLPRMFNSHTPLALGKTYYYGWCHGQNTIKTKNLKCLLYWCLIEFIDWRSRQYFRPLLWTSAPLTFSLVHLPPRPVWISIGVCIYTVWNRGGGRIGLCGEHLQELYTVYLTRFRTYKIALPSQTKTYKKGGGLRQINLPPSPFTGQIF